jgi:hypothetical protein
MMPGEQRSERDPDQLKIFQIRIQGHLSQQWTDWFEGLIITLEEDGNTLLNGPVVDQSALHGILKRIRDLGVPLLSVNSVDANQATNANIDLVISDI